MSETLSREVLPFTQSLQADDVFGVPFVSLYSVKSHLQTSSVAELYVAQNIATEEEAALKVFHPGSDPARVEEEVLTLEELEDDPCFPKLLSDGEARLPSGEMRQFLAMELIPGGNLRDVVSAEQPSDIEVKRIVGKVHHALGGLANLHAGGKVHLDIKPEHIIGEGVVCDVGVAKKVGDTYVGAIGTIGYKAPEIYDGRIVPESDIFSICAATYEVTTNKLPFTVPPQSSVSYPGVEIERERIYLQSLEYDRPQYPHELNPSVPPAVSALIMRGMEYDPQDRPSATELRSEIGPLLGIAA